MTAKVEIKNLDSLLIKLENVKVADLMPLMSKATLIVEAQAKANAPVNDGYLRQSIHPKVEYAGEGVLIGRVYTAIHYAPYVEFGTGVKGAGTYPYDPKDISLQYRTDGWVYSPDGGETFVYTEGMVARPFMYPALAMNKDKINNLFRRGYTELLKKAIGGGV